MITNKKISISLLIALVGFPQISETIYTPALPGIAYGLNTSAVMVEMTLAIYFLGFAVGVLLWGMISDWSGRKNAMLMGLFVYGIGTFSCANVETVETLLVWRFVQAFGASVGSVITQTILRELYDDKERAKLFSIMSGALAFSPAIGPVVGGIISEYVGWRANFWTLAMIAIALSIWSALKLPETRLANSCSLSIKKIYQLFVVMIKSPVLWGHIFLIGATNGILFGFYQEAPFIFIEQMGLPPSLYGFLGPLVAASTILAARVSHEQSIHFSAGSMIQCGAAVVFFFG
jgi:Bcr/CflA subfamily drug resistance transporter